LALEKLIIAVGNAYFVNEQGRPQKKNNAAGKSVRFGHTSVMGKTTAEKSSFFTARPHCSQCRPL